MSETCPDCKSEQCRAYGRGHHADPDDVTICRLRGQLAEAQRENAAWRALAELDRRRYGVAFPGRRTLGDFGGSVTDRTELEPDALGGRVAKRIYGEGATAGEAAINLAVNAGLIPELPKASE